jgi:bifunctional DNA-binding transcriptional regulator/antitoxin component of YhaV-PrlF toxin-antitoxin module
MNDMTPFRSVPVVLNVTEDGRVIIPAQALAELGIAAPDRVSASVVEGEVVLDTLEATVKRMQAYYRQFIPDGVSAVDEPVAERRAASLANVKRAQELLAPYIAGEPSIVDELIAERRAEAERD